MPVRWTSALVAWLVFLLTAVALIVFSCEPQPARGNPPATALH